MYRIKDTETGLYSKGSSLALISTDPAMRKTAWSKKGRTFPSLSALKSHLTNLVKETMRVGGGKGRYDLSLTKSWEIEELAFTVVSTKKGPDLIEQALDTQVAQRRAYFKDPASADADSYVKDMEDIKSRTMHDIRSL